MTQLSTTDLSNVTGGAKLDFATQSFLNNRRLADTMAKRMGPNWREKMWPSPGHFGSGFRDTESLHRYQSIMGIRH